MPGNGETFGERREPVWEVLLITTGLVALFLFGVWEGAILGASWLLPAAVVGPVVWLAEPPYRALLVGNELTFRGFFGRRRVVHVKDVRRIKLTGNNISGWTGWFYFDHDSAK